MIPLKMLQMQGGEINPLSAFSFRLPVLTQCRPRFTATYRTVSVYRVLQMRGGGYADVLPVLQVPDNKADAVPCKRLQLFCLRPGPIHFFNRALGEFISL
jgi:hypothetical protein